MNICNKLLKKKVIAKDKEHLQKLQKIIKMNQVIAIINITLLLYMAYSHIS